MCSAGFPSIFTELLGIMEISELEILNPFDCKPFFTSSKLSKRVKTEKKSSSLIISSAPKSNAESNKESDKKKRESVDSRNQADTIIHSTEKNLKEHGSKISEAEKKAIETAISDLRNVLKGTDTEEVKKKTQSLIQASMKLGEAVYKSQQKPDGKATDKKDNKDNKEKENVVDAEVVDAKEDKEKRA